MRIVRDEHADALYIDLGTDRPARTVVVAEGTVVDLDADGRLLGIEVICMHRDWVAELETILADYGPDLSPADTVRLRNAATACT